LPFRAQSGYGRPWLGAVAPIEPGGAAILDGAESLGLPGWYLGAGAVAQTVWNRAHGRVEDTGIADYDLVYFDPDDLSREAEQAAEDAAHALVAQDGIRIDVTNEARVLGRCHP
jgi:uncharacterized protein